MSTEPTDLRETTRRVLSHAVESDVAFTAAGIAYYAQVSLLPLAVIGFAAVSAVASERLALNVIEATGGTLSPTGERLLRESLTGGAGRVEAGIGGVLVFVWGALRLFRGLKAAVSTVYGTDTGVVVRWRDSAVTLVAVSATLLALLGTGLALRRLGVGLPPPIPGLVSLAVVTGSLYPLYYVLPGQTLTPAEPLPGTVVAAGGLVLLRLGFRVYLRLGSRYAVYGVLGGVVLLVTWLYLASLLLVLGAVVNAVRAGYDIDADRSNA